MVYKFYYKQNNRRRHTHSHTGSEGWVWDYSRGWKCFSLPVNRTLSCSFQWGRGKKKTKQTNKKQCHSKQSEQFWVKLIRYEKKNLLRQTSKNRTAKKWNKKTWSLLTPPLGLGKTIKHKELKCPDPVRRPPVCWSQGTLGFPWSTDLQSRMDLRGYRPGRSFAGD